MAKANPFRFSTKYQDDETDLIYYGYRYYNASMGRWLSTDPIVADLAFADQQPDLTEDVEEAERNTGDLLGFLRNDPIGEFDKLGLWGGDPPSPGMLVDWAKFKVGGLRLAKTQRLTTEHLKNFREIVREQGGCRCKRYFGITR
jgi:RHS repeat-associated protein